VLKAARVPAATLMMASLLAWPLVAQEWRPEFKSPQVDAEAVKRPPPVNRRKLVPHAARASVKAVPEKQAHKLAIQVDENNPQVMNLALNNAKNVVDYYKTKGEHVTIEMVTFGPGLHMLRDDTSPVKQRISAMALEAPNITFIACGNTQTNQSKQENKSITLISEAKVVPSGVVRLMELQGKGYAYIRP